MESIETSDKKSNAKGAWPHLTPEVTIKAEGAVRHAVSSGGVFAIDLFNWYNDWTGLLMLYGDYQE